MGKKAKLIETLKVLVDLIEGEFKAEYLSHTKFIIDYVDVTYSKNDVIKNVTLSGKAFVSGLPLSSTLIIDVNKNTVDIVIGTINVLSMPLIKDKFTKILEESERSGNALFMTVEEFMKIQDDPQNIKDVNDIIKLLKSKNIDIELAKNVTISKSEAKDEYEYLKYYDEYWEYLYDGDHDRGDKKWSRRWEYSNYVCEVC